MRAGTGSWALGTGASVALHAAGAVVALALVAPEEMPQQPTPGAQFELETTALDRSRAEEREAEGDAAEGLRPDAEVAPGQSIARRAATNAAPPSQSLAAAAPAGASLAAAPPEGEALAAEAPESAALAAAAPAANASAAIAPDAARFDAQDPSPVSAPSAAPSATTVRAQDADAPILATLAAEPRRAEALGLGAEASVALDAPNVAAAAFTPSSAVAAEAAPEPQAALPAAPAGETAAPADVAGVRAAAAQAEAPRASAGATNATAALSTDAPAREAASAALVAPVIGAALAWAGQGALDPQGLAAVQAFLPPAARGTEGEEVRDDIAALMSSVPCARVHTAFNAETGALELRGHVPTEDARPRLVGALQARVGETLPVQDALRLLPEPQCNVLAGIEALGLPPSEEQFTDPALVGETGWAQDYSFVEGDAFELALEGPDYPAHVYLDYFDGAGNVVHIVPNEFVALPDLAPEEPFAVGRATGLDLRISPPFGQEIVVAIATEAPLYDGVRPIVEPAAAYLEFLRARLDALAPLRGEWAYFFVTTGPR